MTKYIKLHYRPQAKYTDKDISTNTVILPKKKVKI